MQDELWTMFSDPATPLALRVRIGLAFLAEAERLERERRVGTRPQVAAEPGY